MDRRRYVPSTDGLEVRTMLSTATGSSNLVGLLNPSLTTNQNLPITIHQKEQRIERIPNALRSLEPNRFLPKETVAEIQAGLTQLLSRTHKPPSQALDNFNSVMRKTVFKSSLSAQDARVLNHAFTAVLHAAAAPPDAVNTLGDAMNTLASQVDTNSVNPVNLATNDYALVLQAALMVGKPMPAPKIPSITKNSGRQVDPQHSVTSLANPTFTGTYQAAAELQIFNKNDGAILGTGASKSNGQYSITLSTPLTPGTHELQIRAVDELGHFSYDSRAFVVKYTPPKTHALTIGKTTPQGPLTMLGTASK